MAGKVGETRFELATPCTPYKCATGLRYSPKKTPSIKDRGCKGKTKIIDAKFNFKKVFASLVSFLR